MLKFIVTHASFLIAFFYYHHHVYVRITKCFENKFKIKETSFYCLFFT